MSLLEQQNLLARLYVDENLRRAFLSNPPAIAGQFGLSNQEIAEISGILPGEIDSFADSLMQKRLREVEKILPLTRSALQDSFERVFTRYVDATPSSGEMDRREDVREFCRYLEKEAVGPARDAARFELAKMEFFSGKRNLVIRRFNHDVRNGRLLRRRIYCLWIRVGRRTYWWFL